MPITGTGPVIRVATAGGGITGIVICEANSPSFPVGDRLSFDTFYNSAGTAGNANTLLAPLGLAWDPSTNRFSFSNLSVSVLAEFVGQMGYSATGWVDNYFGDTASPNLTSRQTFFPGTCANPSISQLFPISNLVGLITPVSSVLKYFSVAANYAGTWTLTPSSALPFQYCTLKLTGLA